MCAKAAWQWPAEMSRQGDEAFFCGCFGHALLPMLRAGNHLKAGHLFKPQTVQRLLSHCLARSIKDDVDE